MKLAELLEDFKTVPSKRDWHDTVDKMNHVRSRTGMRKSGGGKYSQVYDLEREPNEVLKVARHPSYELRRDAYFSYIQKVMKLDNPYFPQVDELTKHETDDGQSFFTVKMEKLHPLQVLSDREFQAMFGRIFGRPVDDDEIVNMLKQNVPPARRGQEHPFAEMTATFIENCVETDEYLNKIEDPQLIQAIKMLRILWKAKHMLDIHDENIMVRRTPYGPHLVFTDPFSEIHIPKGQ